MMKRVLCVTSAVLVCATVVAAQGPAQQAPVGLTQYLQNAYAAIKSNLTQAADKLPEADYSFKPATMPGVRTFGQLF
jgi:hypothetical protein